MPEFGDGHWRGEAAEDRVRMGSEDRALGAGEVVLGQRGNLLKELRATLVVEEPRRQRLLRGFGKAGEGGLEDGVVDGEKSGGGHGVLG